MKIAVKYFMLICLATVGLQGMAQDLKADLTTFNKSLLAAKNIEIEIEIQSTRWKGSTAAGPRQVASLKKRENALLYAFENQKIVLNEKRMIMINPAQKTMEYLTLDKENSPVRAMVKNLSESDPTKALIEGLEKASSIDYKGKVGANKKYVVTQSDDPIKSYEIFLDQNSLKISKIVYHYSKTLSPELSRVELKYKTLNLNPSFTDEMFSDASFVTRKGGEYQGVGAYRNFEVTYSEALKNLD